MLFVSLGGYIYSENLNPKPTLLLRRCADVRAWKLYKYLNPVSHRYSKHQTWLYQPETRKPWRAFMGTIPKRLQADVKLL